MTYRFVVKRDDNYYIVLNEEYYEVMTGIRLKAIAAFTTGASSSREDEKVLFKTDELKILRVSGFREKP